MKVQNFLTAEWRYLAMLNYEIDPELLRPYIPQGTELDTWNGKTFVSMVGFLFLNTRVLGWPIPFHTNFEEVNLRFYVRHQGPEGWQRGVVFIKELVPKFAIATVARVFYNENYMALPMRHILERSSASPEPYIFSEYSWYFKGRWHHLRVTTTGRAHLISPGSEEEFITEHYWGYAAQKDGGCMEYQVKHPQWRIWQVGAYNFDCDVSALYGPAFAPYLQVPPSSVFLAEGSPIIVHQGIRI